MIESSKGNAKLSFIGVLLAAIIAAGVAIYIHFDSKGAVEKPITTKSENIENAEQAASVEIKEIYVTPVDFDLPSSFYVEIKNGGLIEAKNINITLDFGESNLEKCSFKPDGLVEENTNMTTNIYKFKIDKLQKNESFYINCFTSTPVFRKVLISGGNLGFDKELNWESYKSRSEKESTSWWYVLSSILGTIFIIYMFIVIMQLIHNKLNIKGLT